MSKLLFFVTLFVTHLCVGQHSLPVQMDTNIYSSEVTTYGIMDYSSTSVENMVFDKFLFGGFIDNEIKHSSLSRHKLHNKIGGEVSGEFDYKNYNLGNLLKGKYGWYARAGFGAYGSAVYTEDLYKLIFFGNAPFIGDTARFSGFEGNLISFQKIGFGLITKRNKSSLGINFYNISDYAEIFVREGEVTSDETGSTVGMALDSRFQIANSNQFNKGWGIGLDGDFRFEAAWINQSVAFFQAQFKNIGLMNINSVDVYRADTSISFSGLKFNQLFGDNNISIDGQEDLMDTLGIQKSNSSVTSFLPGFVQIGKITDQHSTKDLQSFFGVRLYTTLSFNPLVYGGAEYKFFPWMKVGLQALYGGFSKFRVGFYSQYKFKNTYLGIGSENLIGAFSNTGLGQSIHLRLSMRW